MACKTASISTLASLIGILAPPPNAYGYRLRPGRQCLELATSGSGQKPKFTTALPPKADFPIQAGRRYSRFLTKREYRRSRPYHPVVGMVSHGGHRGVGHLCIVSYPCQGIDVQAGLGMKQCTGDLLA